VQKRLKCLKSEYWLPGLWVYCVYFTHSLNVSIQMRKYGACWLLTVQGANSGTRSGAWGVRMSAAAMSLMSTGWILVIGLDIGYS